MKWIKASERLPMFSSRTISRFIASQIILFDAQDFAIRNPNRSNEWEWLDESEPSPVEDVQRMAELSGEELGKLIDKHIGPMYGGLEMASIDYFKQTGTINGSFRMRLISLLKFHQYKLQSGYAAHPPAPAGMEEGYVTYQDLAITAAEMEWPEEILEMIKKLVRKPTTPIKDNSQNR